MNENLKTVFDTEKVNELIRNRRSVYANQYDGRTIPIEIIEQILENANWAPTHKKTEPWRFVVFSGDGLKQFAQKQADLYKKYAKPEEFNEDKYAKLLETPLKASHIISIGMKRHEGIPEVEEICATACAVQNMYLTATAYGIGAYWSTGGMTFQEEAKSFLGLGAEDRLLGFFFLGYPAKEIPDNSRKPIEDKTEWRI